MTNRIGRIGLVGIGIGIGVVSLADGLMYGQTLTFPLVTMDLTLCSYFFQSDFALSVTNDY